LRPPPSCVTHIGLIRHDAQAGAGDKVQGAHGREALGGYRFANCSAACERSASRLRCSPTTLARPAIRLGRRDWAADGGSVPPVPPTTPPACARAASGGGSPASVHSTPGG